MPPDVVHEFDGQTLWRGWLVRTWSLGAFENEREKTLKEWSPKRSRLEEVVFLRLENSPPGASLEKGE